MPKKVEIVRMQHKNFISVLCFILISIGIIIISLKSTLYNYGIKTLLTLNEDSSLFKAWSKSPTIDFDVYVFNWTNPEDFLNHSTKPILKEIGPFRYKQSIEKVNITIHDNGTMSYNRKRTFIFNRDESVHDIDLNITMPNPVAMSLGHKARDWSFFTKKGVSYALRNLIDNKLSVTKPVGEILFTGYKDPILDAATKLSFLTDIPLMEKFAFFYGKNASAAYDGIFTVGIGGEYPLGDIYEWNFNTNTSFYNENCNTFQGSAGDFFPKDVTSDTLSIFHSDVCRTIIADYEGREPIHGIEGVKYVMGDHLLDNGTFVPGNECTCGDHCLPYGVLYATACKGDSPNYLSLPHFYKADSYFADKVTGMNPDPEKHDFYIIYEPTTGIPLEMVPRLQINLLMKPISYIGMFEEIPTVVFPMIWFTQTLAMPSDSAFLVKILLNLKDICLILGISFIILSIFLFLFLVYRIRNTDFCQSEHHQNKNYLPKELVPLKEKETQQNC